MRKLIALTLAALLAMTALCGCNILEMGTAPTLPRIHYDESALTGTCTVSWSCRTRRSAALWECPAAPYSGDGQNRSASFGSN